MLQKVAGQKAKKSYAHQQTPQMQNGVRSADHHKFGSQQPSKIKITTKFKSVI